ncbi:S8 family peptidase [Streptomyces lonarensis]|uniref:S8 family peptidase n=1 Tax=Streptomyces lonarensis TaxID=700599 RepID=UPI00143C5116|nr:S8 family peptidase [Streptomyces lonarensis]
MAVVATGVVLALTAGLGGAAAEPPHHPESTGGGGGSLTLITGDRVLLDATGAVSGLVRGEGREHIPVRVSERDGSTLVVPYDAAPLIEAGTVDLALFDVTELSRKAYSSFAGIPLIVGYEDGSRSVEREVRGGDGVELRARLDVVEADALTVTEESAPTLWQTLTEPVDGDAARLSSAPGVRTVSLDRVRQASLDTAVEQVGADIAHEAGYDGTGVTIAVLDTGIAADHGDFTGRVRAAADFTDDEDHADLHGHGTHVASTAAGSGARSDGVHRGVAPGAELLDARVLDAYGDGFDSWIIEGMEWAVDQGAQIVNMSLGAAVWPGHDPLVDAVDRMSEEHGTLFVVAAGNTGPGAGSVESPGIAGAALTVGAVDHRDSMAGFSSVGPVAGDGRLKPDLTAPGVEIASAASPGSTLELVATPVADGYMGLSGTSMATPVVAGAAALLLQQNPGWTGEQLKAALVSSSAGIDATPQQTGTGRVDVARALEQTVTVVPGSLDFDAVAYPYADAAPATREVTYRNSGDADVTLDLALTVTSPDVGAAAEGAFSLGAESVSVPAGGTATVEVVAEPAAVGESAAGHHGVVVTATSGTLQVRAAGSLSLEPEMADLTVEVIGRDGEPLDGARVFVLGETDGFNTLTEDGAVHGRLPVGRALVEVLAGGPWDAGPEETRTDWALAPVLDLDGPTVLTVDLRETAELEFAAPDPDAELQELAARYESPGLSQWAWFFGAQPEGVHSLAVGETPEDAGFGVSLASFHLGDGDVQYHGHRRVEGAFPTGLVNRPSVAEMARVDVEVGSRQEGATGWAGAAPERFGLGLGAFLPVPGSAEMLLQDTAAWSLSASEDGADGWAVQGSSTALERFDAGQDHQRLLNVGVFGPAAYSAAPLWREGNVLHSDLSLFAPGAAATGWADADSGSTRILRDGELLREVPLPLPEVAVGLPAGEGDYRVVSTASRTGAGYTDVSTEVTLDMTFTSATTDEFEPIDGPPLVRFRPELALDNTAPADVRGFPLPLALHGGEAVSLTVESSVDGGASWVTVHDGAGDVDSVAVDNPAAGGSLSLRATAVDARGDRTVQTIVHAYRTR